MTGHALRRLAAVLAALALILPASSLAAETPADTEAAMFSTLQQHVIGVMGSGSSMSLQVLKEGGIDTLTLAKPWRDGWVLGELTPTAARFDKAGKPSVTVPLNPFNATSGPGEKGPASTIQVTSSATILALAQQAIDQGLWDGKPMPGMSLEESQRKASYDVRLDAFEAQYGPDAQAMLAGIGADNIFGHDVVQDYHTLSDKAAVAVMEINEPARLRVNPRDPDPIKSTQGSIMIAQAQMQEYANHPAIQAYLPGYIDRLQTFLAQLQAGQ